MNHPTSKPTNKNKSNAQMKYNALFLRVAFIHTKPNNPQPMHKMIFNDHKKAVLLHCF